METTLNLPLDTRFNGICEVVAQAPVVFERRRNREASPQIRVFDPEKGEVLVAVIYGDREYDLYFAAFHFNGKQWSPIDLEKSIGKKIIAIPVFPAYGVSGKISLVERDRKIPLDAEGINILYHEGYPAWRRWHQAKNQLDALKSEIVQLRDRIRRRNLLIQNFREQLAHLTGEEISEDEFSEDD